IAQALSWQTFAPDPLVTAGAGAGYLAVAASRSADRTQAVIYIPPDASGSITTVTVDLGRLSGSVTATWQDPTFNASMPAGTGLTGIRAFAKPGANHDGDGDWVLVLRSP